ncbi:MAG: CpsB/CapC family capsule biosynthesis tyrosine phosphatase [Chitinophagaceae bacterium]
MFEFFKKKIHVPADFSGVSIDMHSHLLPGIDDGSPDSSTSMELINGLTDLGFSRFVTTPHIMWDLYQNTPEIIGGALKQLKTEAGKDVKPILKFAAEYFLDDHLEKLLDSDTPLLTIKDNLLLFEFSFVAMPFDYKELIFKIQMKGYKPVLAHPERYVYLNNKREVYDELKSAGCLFQVNILSLANYYGKHSNDIARYLIEKSYIDLVGTDLHHHRHLDALRNAGSVMPIINQLLDSGKLLNPGL